MAAGLSTRGPAAGVLGPRNLSRSHPMTFDPNRKLVMDKFKTVHGFNLNRGTRLTLAAEPARAGEVTEARARRLWSSGLAVYAEDFGATPVETAGAAAIRQAAEIVEDAGGDVGEVSDVPPDLVTWQQDDEALGRRAGDRVTNDDLRAIAEREGIAGLETDDNKATMQMKIVAGRAAQATGGASGATE